MLIYFIAAYIFIGVCLNFIQPFKGELWVAKMNFVVKDEHTAIGLFIYLSLLRISIIILYPFFLFINFKKSR